MCLPLYVFTIVALDFPQTAFPCTGCDGVNVACVDGECLPRCVNVASSGECLQCRDFSFWGQQCENTCSSTCLHSRCQRNNTHHVCTDGCVPGKKGDNCEVDCPSNCVQCERYGVKCIEQCNITGHYGDNCDKPCIGSCAGRCDTNTGICDNCADGYTGERCTLECPSVCTQCERYGQRCIGQCSSTDYYGDKCQKICPGNCKGGCDRRSGECDSCKSGHTGKYCNMTCPTNCIEGCDSGPGECAGCRSTCRNGCNRVNGECYNCVAGIRGKYCNEICSSTCTECDQYLNICTGPCPTNDVYGDNCSIPCPHVCNGCDKDTGACEICAAGYSRTYCDEMCSKCTGSGKQCNSNKCTTRDPHLLLKVIFGVLGVIILTGVIFSSRKLFYKIRIRFDRADEQHNTMVSTDHSDQSQYWATKYWEINDEDLESDPFTNRNISAQRGRCLSPLEQRDERPSVSSLLRQDIPIRCQSNLVKSQHQVSESCLLSDVGSVLENDMYTSADVACAPPVCAAARLSTPSCPTPDINMCDSGEEKTLHTDNTCRERWCSVSSEDLRLTKKMESQIIWEQNSRSAEVYVKYVTPKRLDDTSCW